MLNPRGDGGISMGAAMQQLKHSVMAAKTKSGASAEPGFEHVPIVRTPSAVAFKAVFALSLPTPAPKAGVRVGHPRWVLFARQAQQFEERNGS